MGREPKTRGAMMAFNGVEDSVGVKAGEQDERRTELNEAQQADKPAHMRHRQGHDHDVIVGKSPMLDD